MKWYTNSQFIPVSTIVHAETDIWWYCEHKGCGIWPDIRGSVRSVVKLITDGSVC